MSRLDRYSSHRPLLTATLLSVVSLVLVQCDRNSSPEPSLATEAPAEVPTPTPVIAPTPVSALTRGELVSAAGQAASAYARGQIPTETDPLVGRGFAVRIPFGCTGPSEVLDGTTSDGVARWTWRPDRKTIQLSLTPGDWTGSALAFQPGPAANASPVWEAVEGFWVPRPWLAAETCPDVRADPPVTGLVPASPQTVGIAAVFEAGGSRIGRRDGRAYVFTVRSQSDHQLAAPTGGYRLLLEGRIVGFPGGRAIRCLASGPDERPVCVAAVQLDKVAFQTATGETLGEWRPG